MYSIRNTDYLQKLVESGKRVIKVSEIATLWGIDDKNKLHTYLKRYAEKKQIYRLAKGVYSIIDPTKLHTFEIGVAVAGELAYVSLETVLFLEGRINQPVQKTTLVGKKSKEFEVYGHTYICYYLPITALVDRRGIIERDGYAIATIERALTDMKTIKPHYFMDAQV